MVELELLGAINKPGRVQVPEDITFKQLLEKYCGGMLRKYPRPIVMQVGGPMGAFICGSRLNEFVKDHAADVASAHIVTFFGERFCPVDFVRFVTRFLVREVGIDTSHVRVVNRCIEDITNGRAELRGLEQLRELAAVDSGLTFGEHRLNVIIDELMDQFGNEFVEHAVGKHCHFSVCRGLLYGGAPCINTCPSNMNVPGYIELIKHDRLADAYTLMKRDNPLSLVCGKICPAPCESRCRQGDITDVPVAIRQLKRFIADHVVHNTEYHDDRRSPNGKRVAIVGTGPAGMSAAFYLAKTGYQVIMYDANARVGGMLAMVVPEFRLPYADVVDEFDYLSAMGVQTVLNTRVGRDIPLARLRKDNDVVLLASGRTIGRTLGPSCAQIEPALTFLREVKLGKRTKLPSRVVIIGGGAVALDVAMTAVRMGSLATVIVRETKRDLMPVAAEELAEAEEDGVKLLIGWATKDFVVNDNRMEKVLLHRSVRVLDDDAHFAPLYDESGVIELEADLVVIAIGQTADLSYLDSDISTDDRNNIILNSAFQTTAEGVFAAGDIKKPGLAISAIGEGKQVAMSIDHYLGGNGIYFGRDIDVPETLLEPTIWEIPRERPQKLDTKKRSTCFSEVESTLTLKQAKSETNRCMRCDRNSVQELFLRHPEQKPTTANEKGKSND